MRILVTWGTKRGGTEGIARIIGAGLESEGFDVTVAPASKVPNAHGYDAAIIGGALYGNLWHRDARRFVNRNVAALRRIPVWLFSSGPLDDSADRAEIPSTAQVAILMERIGALGHMTFGGRLSRDAKGFPAAAMATKQSGDWRNPDRILAWALELAHALPNAQPGVAIDHPARSLWRLAEHGVVGWVLCAAVIGGVMQMSSIRWAMAIHATLVPLIFTFIAIHYFRARGARDPLPTALALVGIVAVLDAVVVAGLTLRSFAMFKSFAGTWLPFALIVLSTWTTGYVMSMMPPRKGAPPATQRPLHASGSPHG